MIKAKLINSNASLNDFIYVGAAEFIPGENVTVALQIFLTEKNIRYIPADTAEMTLTFVDSNGDDVDKAAAVIDPDDRSMWSVSLSQAETETLAGQNIIGKLDIAGDGSVVYYFLLANVMIRTNLAGDC